MNAALADQNNFAAFKRWTDMIPGQFPKAAAKWDKRSFYRSRE
jgi:hypothetical protein